MPAAARHPPSHAALAALPAVASGLASTRVEGDEAIVGRHARPFD